MSGETSAPTMDSDDQLFDKGQGKPGQLCYTERVPIKNRSGLVVHSLTTRATSAAEREAAIATAEAIPGDLRKRT